MQYNDSMPDRAGGSSSPAPPPTSRQTSGGWGLLTPDTSARSNSLSPPAQPDNGNNYMSSTSPQATRNRNADTPTPNGLANEVHLESSTPLNRHLDAQIRNVDAHTAEITVPAGEPSLPSSRPPSSPSSRPSRTNSRPQPPLLPFPADYLPTYPSSGQPYPAVNSRYFPANPAYPSPARKFPTTNPAPPYEPMTVQKMMPPEEICLECTSRDRDMADIDVRSPGVWDRDSDVWYQELVKKEDMDESRSGHSFPRPKPSAKGDYLTEDNLALWLKMVSMSCYLCG